MPPKPTCECGQCRKCKVRENVNRWRGQDVPETVTKQKQQKLLLELERMRRTRIEQTESDSFYKELNYISKQAYRSPRRFV